MNVIEVSYILLSLFCFVFIFRPNRVFDVLTIGFLGQQVYFLPLLFQPFGTCSQFGCVSYEVYVVGVYFILCFLFAAAVSFNSKVVVIKPVFNISSFWLATIVLSFLGFAILMIKSSGAIFYLPKREMMKFVGYEYIIWSTASILSLCAAVEIGSKIKFVISFILVMIIVFIGFRSPAAIAMIAAVLLYSSKNSISSSNIKAKYIALALFGVMFFFIYKGIYSTVKLGRYDLLVDRLTDIEYYLNSVRYSEPFTTISLLSNTLKDDLRVDSEHTQAILLSFGFFGWMNVELPSFNSVIQPIFYSHMSGGVGSNVWANVYAMWGYLGLFSFISFYVFSLLVLSKICRGLSLGYSSILVTMSAYWAFYIHRNDLTYQLTLEKRVVIVALVAILMSYFLNVIKKPTSSNLDL